MTHVAQAILVFGSLVVLGWFLAGIGDVLRGGRDAASGATPGGAGEPGDGALDE